MDIYQIMSSKPHNSHHLKRYISFIESCVEKNVGIEGYVEKHHICPKSKNMFPEYSNLKVHPWNLAKLTYRQHIISHIMLYKIFHTECQALAILFISKQHHVNQKINTKSIEKAKKYLSDARKGKFMRGYDSEGNPNVSVQTREKLSNLKKEYYSNPENRKKQSLACTGTTGRKSEKYKEYANNRSESHKQNHKKSIKLFYSNLSEREKKRINKGIYVTPIGKFTQTKLSKYCIYSDKPITIHTCKFQNSLFNESVIGMTPRQLGFFFITKQQCLELLQDYADLNLAHLPEPNHPLASKLNDYLLHEKLLP